MTKPESSGRSPSPAPAEATQFFFSLTPDRVLEAVEAGGLRCTGRCLALNSFENRVYDVELELDSDDDANGSALASTTASSASSAGPTASADAAARARRLPTANRRVVKFYRPGRWSKDQILEEHEFLQDLLKDEIPVVAPEPFPDGETLKKTPDGEIWYALFPKVGGRAPDEMTDEQLRRLGRLLARIHNVGARRSAPHRVSLTPQTYGRQNLDFLLAGNWIPIEFRARYESAVRKICAIIEPWFAGVPAQRIHGDCHLGNLLWSPEGPFFLDFDDMVQGPPVQDLWLLLPGRPGADENSKRQLEALLEGYEEMRAFDRTSLRLIEPLRALRFVHYTAWLARRWEDPAFPLAFPQFGSHRYWSDETADLEEQLSRIEALSGPGIHDRH